MFLLRNRLLPPKPYSALTLGPLVLLRKGAKLTPTLLRHENIHWRQCMELLLIGFYIWYVAEWLIRLCQELTPRRRKALQGTLAGTNSPIQRAYLRISFEREAYAHQGHPNYLRHRRAWAFLRYL